MRLRPIHSAFLLFACSALLSAFSVSAQEEKIQAEMEVAAKETVRNDPDPVLSESDFRTNKPIHTPASTKETIRDTLQVKIIKPIKSIEGIEREEDPLSFNFLYYLIEKFKLSDIIE